MQVTETSAEGLKREIKVVVNAAELTERRDKRLDEIKDTVQIKGFRRGKVPVAHLRKVYGRQLMAEVLQQAVEETSREALTERGERPASQPEIDLADEENQIEPVIKGEADLAYSMSYEIIPKFDIVSFESLELEKLVSDVEDSEIDKALEQLAERNVSYEATQEGAGEKDKLKIDFVGRIDGEPFEGGTSDDIELVIGQGGFIPGFEEGLQGAKAGEDHVVNVTFPEAYPVDELKGKPAVFDVKVKEVSRPKMPEINDEFAQNLGAEDLVKLREMVSEQIGREYEQISRAKLKRGLLDELDQKHDFELPASLVTIEFDGIWEQLQKQMEQAGRSFEADGKNEEDVRAQYQKVAERRVRLGLVLGDVGEQNSIEVTQDELRQALLNEARQYPGHEKFVYEYYEKTPGAIAQLRAPIFEDKTVDLILSKANVTERKVPVSELTAPMEGDEDELDAAKPAVTDEAAQD